MFSKNFLDSLLLQISIVEVINEYVPLKKTDCHFKGNCPFHGEKTASFKVYRNTQSFNCYGCKISGNVITFIMEFHFLTFPDAVKYLCSKYNIPLEDTRTARKKASRVRRRQNKQYMKCGVGM